MSEDKQKRLYAFGYNQPLPSKQFYQHLLTGLEHVAERLRAHNFEPSNGLLRITESVREVTQTEPNDDESPH